MRKLLFLLAFIILFPVRPVLANFSDQETVSANLASTGWWVKPTVSVTAPDGGEKLIPGSTYLITWVAASTDPAATVSVDISYSLDDGVSYSSIVTGHDNDGSSLWTIPDSTSLTAKIKVTATDSHALSNFDESDAVFTIANPPVTTLRVNDKSVAETITGNWNITGDVSTISAEIMRVGSSDPVNDGQTFDQNILSQTISNTVKNIFFSYNFQSYDFPPYDAPGFRFAVNDQPLLELWAKDVNPDSEIGLHSTGWQNFSFDPSIFTAPTLNLNFMAGNSDNAPELNSWADIKNLTTATVSANLSTVYTATATSGIPSVIVTPTTVTYYSVDPLLPAETSKTQDVSLKTSALPAITDLDSVATTSSSLELKWTSNGGVAYDLSYGSTRVTPWPTPRPYGQEMTATVTDLTSDTNYCFTVKSVDDTPQWSVASNVVCAKTLASPPVANLHDVVINEVMWMGSSISTADEWIELKNTTDNSVNLDGWSIAGITLSGSIEAHGYFLLANYPVGDSAISDSITVDQNTLSLELNNAGEQLTLRAGDNVLVDQTPSGSWPAGENGPPKQSMERDDDLSGWHTCVNTDCNSSAYWDSSGTDYGTPRSANLSLNDKTSQEYRKVVVARVATESASLNLTLNENKISLSVINIAGYKKLSYELTYDTDIVPQGVTGNVDLLPGQTEYSKEIVTGTCSTGGTCVYHSGVKNIKLIVTLINKDGVEIILDKSL